MGPGDPIEFAYRVLHLPNGGIDPDVTLPLLMVGHRPALQWLFEADREQGEAFLTLRGMLTHRFAPQLAVLEGEHVGTEFAVPESVEAIHVLGALTIRHLSFDKSSRTFWLDSGG